MNNIFNIFNSSNNTTSDNTKELQARKKYNNSALGRVITAKSHGNTRFGGGKANDLTGNQLLTLLREQDYFSNGEINCACCGDVLNYNSKLDIHTMKNNEPFDFKFDIAHKDCDAPVTKSNIQILCHSCNLMQQKINIDFTVIIKVTNKFFRDIWYYRNNTMLSGRDFAIDTYNLKVQDIKRIDNHSW